MIKYLVFDELHIYRGRQADQLGLQIHFGKKLNTDEDDADNSILF
jgi:hypothetical protein